MLFQRYKYLIVYSMLISLSCNKDNLTGPKDNSVGTFIRYTTSNGLPDNHITSITTDPDGKVWCGTQAGLAFFDGSIWHEYSIADIDSVLYIDSMAFSSKGELWIYASYLRFDGQPIKTYFFKFDGNEWIDYFNEYELFHYGANSIAIDVNGVVWVGHGFGGVSYLNGESWNNYDPGEGGHVFSLSLGNNEIWAGTWGGLLRYNGLSWNVLLRKTGFRIIGYVLQPLMVMDMFGLGHMMQLQAKVYYAVLMELQ